MAILLSVGLLCACASTTPVYDTHAGDAVRQARLQMTRDAATGANPDSVAGLDGRAAREALNQYRDSFKTPPPVVNVINIGGAVGSGNK
jgi:hypothetical protein